MDAKTLVAEVSAFIQRLNATSLKRIFIYVVVIYPLVFGIYYKDEIVYLLTKQDKQVKVRRLDAATKRCYDLRLKYGTEAVLFYVYQPDDDNKTYMERISVSTGRLYQPLESNSKIRLLTRTHELEDIRKLGYVKVTKNSGHVMSNLLVAYDLETSYIIPIRDVNSGSMIGEVVYVFEKEVDTSIVQSLIHESQLFAYDIE